MININGSISNSNQAHLSISNRGFTYGDAVFETVKVSNGKVLFWEDHYFRLMASMRILRMEIPMNFTLEFLENQIKDTLEANSLEDKSARVKLIVERQSGGLYLPNENTINFYISTSEIENAIYLLNDEDYIVDLYKDNYISPTILSTLKTNNKALNVVASIYANENDLNNCFLLNTNKSVAEAINSNVFIVKGKTVKTPPLTDGCLKGVMRKQVIEILNMLPDYTLEEASISPFELQKADEVFLTNVVQGVQSVTKYRKKSFSYELAKELIGKLNLKVRLG